MDHKALAQALFDALAKYDRENHSYYSYYLAQGQEGAVLILEGILKELFPDTTVHPTAETPTAEAPANSVRFG